MHPSILVLANLSETAALATQYAAALGASLHARLHLLNIYHDPILDPELTTVTTASAHRSRADTAAGLHATTAGLPGDGGIDVTVSTNPMPVAVATAVRRDQPLLLALGLSAERDLLDHLLHNQLLPVLRATQWPLLLVPEGCGPAHAPRRVVLAVDAEPFTPNRAALALAPLLASWQARYTVVHVTMAREYLAAPGRMALADVRASQLLPATTPLALRELPAMTPLAGIRQVLDEMEADLLVLVARPRSFLGRLFHRSVTAQLVRHSAIPVLLLPVEGPE
jgi:nucleotide-binding universal stress UspA family protein